MANLKQGDIDDMPLSEIFPQSSNVNSALIAMITGIVVCST